MGKGYMFLADGIVKRACEDFIDSSLKLLRITRVKTVDGKTIYKKQYYQLSEAGKADANRMIIDCVNFFESDWFTVLKPKMDGKNLVRTLQSHVEDIIAECEKQEKERIETLKKRGKKKGTKATKPYNYTNKTGRPRKVVQD